MAFDGLADTSALESDRGFFVKNESWLLSHTSSFASWRARLSDSNESTWSLMLWKNLTALGCATMHRGEKLLQIATLSSLGARDSPT